MFVPMLSCRHGLVSPNQYENVPGFFTNVPDLEDIVLRASKKTFKRGGRAQPRDRDDLVEGKTGETFWAILRQQDLTETKCNSEHRTVHVKPGSNDIHTAEKIADW